MDGKSYKMPIASLRHVYVTAFNIVKYSPNSSSSGESLQQSTASNQR